MAPPKYLPVVRLLFVAAISLFWGAFVALQTLWGILRYGPKAFYVKTRWTSRPEVLDDPALGTHHTARLKNIRLHYVSKGPEGAPLVLFVHGFPELWYSWRFQLREFGKDFRAVAIDMRGYSESEKPQGIAEYRMEKLSNDIKDFVDYLGYKKCFLVAHDWGGAVAWNVAAKYPSIVEKLVVCNCPHSVAFAKHMQSHFSQLLKSWYMFFFQLPCFPESYLGKQDLRFLKDVMKQVPSKNMTDEDIEAFMYTFKNSADLTGPVNYYRAAMRLQPEPIPSLRVPVSTLIIWGTKDFALEKKMAEASKRFVDGDCRIAYIEGASHWVQQDQPELVNREIRQFLEGKKSS